MSATTRLLAACFVCTAAASAVAHRLDAAYDADAERIEFFFGDGSPAVDLDGPPTAAAGSQVSWGRTVAAGGGGCRPPGPGRWTIGGQAAGHSNGRDPLVIESGEVPAPLSPASRPAVASQPASLSMKIPPATRPHARGEFPLFEMVVGLSFVAALTIVTLLMMRRAARMGHTHSHGDLAHDLAQLRAELQETRRELDRLKERRDAGA